jgi:hypothetical protein
VFAVTSGPIRPSGGGGGVVRGARFVAQFAAANQLHGGARPKGMQSAYPYGRFDVIARGSIIRTRTTLLGVAATVERAGDA